MDRPNKSVDILVAGSGPVGMLAALAFAQDGFRVALAGPPANRADGRTTALMIPALAFLDRLGVLEAVRPQAAPLRTLRIVDATRRLVRSPTVTFHAAEIEEPYFGLNIPNEALNAALEERIDATPSIERHVGLVDGWRLGTDTVAAFVGETGLAARLAVAADGRDSLARAAAGIRATERPYNQSALVTGFSHTRAHGDVSTEFHTETGPFTQVPLPEMRSSLVWVTTPSEAARLMALDDEALARRIENGMQSMLGRVTVDARRAVYPLSSSLPAAFAARRIALVGEAAHLFPPIGAQGLNLGIRDIADLVSVAAAHAGDPGSEAALSAYDRRRRPDILARSGAVALLNRSLLSDMLPAQIARSAGLGLLGAFAPLRALFMREGLESGSGFGALASTAREQVRR